MRMPHRKLLILTVVAALVSTAALADIDPNRYLGHVKYLASPALKGRGTGTPGLEKAAGYIAKQLRADKLKPPTAVGYFQRFPVTTNAKLGPKNSLEWSDANGKMTLKPEQDFMPFNFSSSGKLEGNLVFAGYGITAPEYHYDDYAGIDAKGKIAVVLRHEPQENDEKSVFNGKMLTEHAQFWSKAVNAKQHGAVGVILVNDQANHKDESDALEKFGRAAGPADAGLPFLQVKTEVAEKWVEEGGKKLSDLAAAIDKDLKPQSFALPQALSVTESVDVVRERKVVRNVLAYLPGETKEYVIIGAHYDHLGLGEQNSMAPKLAGTPHPGADDNASGTAGLLELARNFASDPKHQRGILFLAFAGEELGLLGSRYYVDHPVLPLADAVAMINLDMIGRPRDHKIFVGGVRSGSSFKELVDGSLPKYQMKPDYSGMGEAGSSDHQSFASKQMPVLFFFSGLHADYHKPSDTWDKIDAPAASEVLRGVADITEALRDAPARPQYVKVAATAPQGGGGGRGYGAWFGSVPDFGETKGVKFADVTQGSPADKAGLKGGDILVEFDGKPISNLYDFTYALRAKKPGETVPVKVLRGGETIEVKVLLGQRQ